MMALYFFDKLETTHLNPQFYRCVNLKYNTVPFTFNFMCLWFQHAEENPNMSKGSDGEGDGNSVNSESQHKDDINPTADSKSVDTPNKIDSDKSKKMPNITP